VPRQDEYRIRVMRPSCAKNTSPVLCPIKVVAQQLCPSERHFLFSGLNRNTKLDGIAFKSALISTCSLGTSFLGTILLCDWTNNGEMECVMGHRYQHLDDLIKCNRLESSGSELDQQTLFDSSLAYFLELMHLPAALGWEFGF